MKLQEIEKIYNAHFEKLYRFFYYKTLDKTVAEDLTSQTFLSMIEMVRKGSDIENPVKFLYGIAKNTFGTYLRNKYKIHEINNIDWDLIEETYVEKTLDGIEKTKDVRTIAKKYIKMLPSSQKIVMELRFVKGLTLSEIAKKLGKDMNYVKTTQKRGIKSLKKIAVYTKLY